MKPVYLFVFVFAFLSACQSNKNGEAGIPITKDSLTGNWMIIKLSTTSSKKEYENMMKSVVNPMKNKIEGAIYSFQPSGTLLLDEGGLTLTNGNWQLKDNKQLLIQHQDSTSSPRTIPFSITGYRNDSLVLENIFENKKENLHITYTLKRLKYNYAVPDLFLPVLNKWRQKPLQPESEAALRLRLKQILSYYSAYFANISHNKILFFNTEKVQCPLMFYSDGLGLRPFIISEEWTKLFFDNRDAEKAYIILKQSFVRLKDFPDREKKLALAFSISLETLADDL
ncbi:MULTISPECIES: hypothetical protein [Niastella]|uniref:Lipocalin-like domain-containing protein n=1 Tax=Niastella soli TaxID=2821487 RepID=A0ABS3YM75_9BACT|nr:hypothetical protein [Niastella soli]MBO9198980.1 hypothetical protein [Niastella soli]